MGFNLRGGVQKTTIPQVILSIDDTLCLNGALSKHAEFRKAMELDGMKWPGDERETKAKEEGTKRKRQATRKDMFFKGESWTFDVFWRKFMHAITNHDVVPYSVIKEGIEELKKQAVERAQVENAIREEEELRAAIEKEQAECKEKYKLLFTELKANEVLTSILNDDKILTGDDVRPGDPGFEFEVPPKGKHCALLAKLLSNLGFTDLEVHAEFDEECWWNGDLAQAWTTLQECQEMEMQDGVVEKECFEQVLVDPEVFLDLKERVKDEIDRIREEEEGFALPRSGAKKPPKAESKQKPSMEALCQRLGMPLARLQWLHELFEGFLQTDDGEPVFCNYPEDPATLNKAQMKTLIEEVKPDISDAEFEARFNRIDEDGSGLIEFDEFAIWVRQDEVRIVGASARKMDFEELAALHDEDVAVIQYVYHLFVEQFPEEDEDDYPEKPALLPKRAVKELQVQLNPAMTDAEFEMQYQLVDMESKGGLSFDEVLEVIGVDELPQEIRDSAATYVDSSPKSA